MSGENLRANQQAAVPILAAGGSQGEAAKVAGVEERTVRRWLELPEFRHEVTRIRGELFAEAAGKLAAGAGEAADYLTSVASGEVAGGRQRINAARLVLVIGPQLREQVELADRVAELEERV